jgi:hypothetical protein
MIVTLPAAGVVIGTDRDGTPVLLPAVGARPVRIGVLAFPPLVLAFRLLGVGCEVTVCTQAPQRWGPLEDRRLHVSAGGQWPTSAPAPPGAGAGPQVLISDLPTPPARGLGDQPWCTVIHVALRVPPGSDFWAAADAVLTRGAGEEPVLVVGRRSVPFRPVVAQAEAPLLPLAAVGVQAHANPGAVPGR